MEGYSLRRRVFLRSVAAVNSIKSRICDFIFNQTVSFGIATESIGETQLLWLTRDRNMV